MPARQPQTGRLLPAARRTCSLNETDYSQISTSIRGLNASRSAVEAAHRELNGTLLVTIRGGRLVQPPRFHPPVPVAEHTTTLWQRLFGLGAPLLGYHAPFWLDLLEDFVAHLPDMQLLFNLFDEPRRWVGALSAGGAAGGIAALLRMLAGAALPPQASLSSLLLPRLMPSRLQLGRSPAARCGGGAEQRRPEHSRGVEGACVQQRGAGRHAAAARLPGLG